MVSVTVAHKRGATQTDGIYFVNGDICENRYLYYKSQMIKLWNMKIQINFQCVRIWFKGLYVITCWQNINFKLLPKLSESEMAESPYIL